MLLFLNVGGGEMFVIIFFVLIFFGTKNMPEMARGLGKGIREVKDALNGVQVEIQREINSVETSVKKHIDDANLGIDDVKKHIDDVSNDLKKHTDIE
jgi:sec-independent protein translocase protein TatA